MGDSSTWIVDNMNRLIFLGLGLVALVVLSGVFAFSLHHSNEVFAFYVMGCMFGIIGAAYVYTSPISIYIVLLLIASLVCVYYVNTLLNLVDKEDVKKAGALK